MWDTITNWWHNMWAPSPHQDAPATPAPAAPAPDPAADEREAQTYRGMTLGTCGLNVPLIGGDHPTKEQAQTEWGMCMAYNAQQQQQQMQQQMAPAPTPGGDGYN